MDFHILHQFADQVLRGFEPHIDYKLRPREIHLLMMIDQEPDKPLRFYARHVGLERGSFTYLTEVMEHRGYVIRKEDEEDRRKKTLELTELGLSVIKEAKQEMDRHLDHVFETFTMEEKEELKTAMDTLERLFTKLPKPHHHHKRPHHRHPESHPHRRPHSPHEE